MIYLDNAATTLHKPPEVAEAVKNAILTAGNASRGAHGVSLSASRTVFETRSRLAKLFGCPRADHVVFTANSTEALNIAIYGLFSSGDHVISTDLEHNSVLRPLYDLQTRGVSVDFVPADRQGNIRYEDMETLFRPETKAVVCTHASNLTGNLRDIAKIGAMAHAHGALLIVDASQTAGAVPIDMQRMNIDVLCFTGHKGLLGPQGTGLLLCAQPGTPLLYGGTGTQSLSREMPEELPERLEAGTLNVPGYAGLTQGLSYLNRVGTEGGFRREQGLAEHCAHGVIRQGFRVFAGPHQGATVSFVPSVDCETGAELLARQGFAVRAGLHCAPLAHKTAGTLEEGTVRLSVSAFNQPWEMDAAARQLRQVCSRAGA